MASKARRTRALLVIGIAVMALYVLARVAFAVARGDRPWDQGPREMWEPIIVLSPLPALFLAVIGCAGAVERLPRGPARWGWAFASAAYVAWAAGSLVRVIFQLVLRTELPLPALTDLLIWAGYILAIPTLLRFLRGAGGQSNSSLPVFDILLTMIGAGALVWHFVLNEQVTQLTRAQASLAAVYGTVLYDLAYLALTGTLVAMFVRAQPGAIRPAVALLAAGLVLRVASDWGQAYLRLQDAFYPGHAVEIGWILGDVLVACGAFLAWRQSAPREERTFALPLMTRPARLLGTVQTLVPFASIGVIAWLMLHDSMLPDYRRDGALIGWLIAATIMLALRQAVAANEQQRLYALVAAREAELDRLVKQLLRAQEDERRVIAYDLHDGLTQTIISAHLHLETLASLPDPAGAQAREELGKGLQRVKAAIDEVRRVTSALRPAALDDLGLMPALMRNLADQAAEAGWETEVEDGLQGARLNPAVETALFRIGQEALTNARKYAQASRVRLALTRTGDRLRLEVRDWGRGFTSAGPPDEREHVGLVSMDERARLLGGVCTVESAPGEGTLIRVEIPLKGSEDGRA